MRLQNHSDKYSRALEQLKVYSEKLKHKPKDKQVRREYASALREAKLAGIHLSNN